MNSMDFLHQDLTDPGLKIPRDTSISEGLKNTLPSNIHSAKSLKLERPVVVQIIDAHDISTSRSQQLEELKSQLDRASPHGARALPHNGRLMDLEQTQFDGSSQLKFRMHKLIVQDSKGNLAFGLILKPIAGLTVIKNGTKLMLSNVVVQRGVLLLGPECVQLLGGESTSFPADINMRILKLERDLKDLSEEQPVE